VEVHENGETVEGLVDGVGGRTIRTESRKKLHEPPVVSTEGRKRRVNLTKGERSEHGAMESGDIPGKQKKAESNKQIRKAEMRSACRGGPYLCKCSTKKVARSKKGGLREKLNQQGAEGKRRAKRMSDEKAQ